MTLTDLIGTRLAPQAVVIERGPVSFFAHAVTDESAVYHDALAAEEAGFDRVPAPPTFAFAMGHMGALAERQPDPEGRMSVREAFDRLKAGGGLILHGEQAFRYQRPVQVGDELVSDGRVADVWTKESSSGKTMTFMDIETEWRDADGQPVVTSTMTCIRRA